MKFIIELEEDTYNDIIHELVRVANYLHTISEYFDERGMLESKNKLIRISKDLRQSTKDTD